MRNVVMLGDIHGDFKPIRDLYNNNQAYFNSFDDNVLIILGDFGANFFMNRRDREFKERLGKYPFTYFIIRGNHEERPSLLYSANPRDWHDEIYFENRVLVENEYPYIKYATDIPLVYNIEGFETLSLPGAYSVDKDIRLSRGWSWFENEQMTGREMGYARDLCEKNDWFFDMVLSHTCPWCFMPTDLFLSVVDQNFVDKRMEKFFGDIEYQLDYHLWTWGHYHATRVYSPITDDNIHIKQPLMLYNTQAFDLSNYIKNDTIKFLDVKGVA